jgi:type III pantothenate kinase
MRSPDFPYVIVVDIGSTRIHVGLIDLDGFACQWRADFLSSELQHYLPAALDRAHGKAQAATRKEEFVPVVIGGGRATYAPAAEAIIKAAGARTISHVRYRLDLPLAFSYEHPEGLGADRIAHALYAQAMHPGRNVIIIGSGTAITVDMVGRDRRFLGGVIMAGAEVQLQGLHAATRVLPLLTVTESAPPFPGVSTESCMLAGAVHGIAGALNGIVRNYQERLHGDSIVLATGGAWSLTEKLVDFTFEAVPDMTLIGTGLFLIAD